MLEAYTVGAEENYDTALAAAESRGERVKKTGKHGASGLPVGGVVYGGGIVFLSEEAARAKAGEYIIKYGYPFAVYTLELESLDQTYVKDADDQRYLLANVPVGKKVEA